MTDPASDSVAVMPRPVGRSLPGSESVDIAMVFRSPLIQVLSWRCLRDTSELRAERKFDSFVLGVPHAGASTIHSGGRSAVVDPTCLLLHSPQVPYRTEHPFGCQDHGSSVAVRSDLVLDALWRHRPRMAAQVLEGRRTATLLARVEGRARLRQTLLVERLKRGRRVDPMALEESAVELLDLAVRPAGGDGGRDRRVGALRAPLRRATQERRRAAVEAARGLLNQRYRELLQLDDLARKVGTSPFHLCRLFKSSVGITPHQYLMRLRLAEAIDRLIGGESSLAELAAELGFSSHSHFTSAFRSQLGVPPSEVRRLARSERRDLIRRVLGPVSRPSGEPRAD